MRDEANMVNAKMAEAAWEKEQLSRAGTTMGAMQGSPQQISMRESLMGRLRRSNEEHTNVNRAMNILEAHPEFEDLLWLIRSGVI
jgi:hypothetical protein